MGAILRREVLGIECRTVEKATLESVFLKAIGKNDVAEGDSAGAGGKEKKKGVLGLFRK